MPTNRQRRTRGQTGPVPQWLTRYLKTGETPPRGTEDHQEFDAWFLLAGYGASKGWPEPPPPAIPGWWTDEQKAAERKRRGEPEPQ